MSIDPKKWGSKEAFREWRMSPVTQSMLAQLQSSIEEGSEAMLRAALSANSVDDVAALRARATATMLYGTLLGAITNAYKGEDDGE